MIVKTKSVDGVVLTGNMVDRVEHVAVGIDVGSTETRLSIADRDVLAMYYDENPKAGAVERLKRTYIIPSSAVILEGDNREITPASDALHDNYDTNIIAVETSAEKPMFTSARILRGQKIDDTKGTTIRYFDSSTDKMDNALFYLNILDSIGYAVLQEYDKVGVPRHVFVDLKISVRPKELNSHCKNKMMGNLIGRFIFKWCGRELELNIKNLGFTTEPEAQIHGNSVVYSVLQYTGTPNEKEMAEKVLSIEDCTTYMHIEGGGSSIGVEVVRNGAIINACSATFQLGGNYLNQIIADRVNEVLGIRASIHSIADAVKTGLLRNGRSKIDISEICANCKSQIAMNILENIRHEVIDTQPDLFLRDIAAITLGGRLFREDECGQSIATYFHKYVSSISPETDVLYLENNYIPQANMVMAAEDFFDETEAWLFPKGVEEAKVVAG